MTKNTTKVVHWFNRLHSTSDILTLSLMTCLFVITMVVLLNVRRRKRRLMLNAKPYGVHQRLLIDTSRKGSKSNIITSSSSSSNNSSNTNDNEDVHQTLTHNWIWTDLFTQPTYCNVCEHVIVSGVCCSYCNLYADWKCAKRADKQFKCKEIVSTTRGDIASEDGVDGGVNNDDDDDEEVPKWKHHWVKGNLKLANNASVCCVCNEGECGCAPTLSDFKCAWCWHTAHEACLKTASTTTTTTSKKQVLDECTFNAAWHRLLLKPNFIRRKESATSDAGSICLTDIEIRQSVLHANADNAADWTPLFVFANPKSGNHDADAIIRIFTTLLNPLQVQQ